MPKTKNIPRAQWEHATQSNLATTSNHHNTTTTAATLTSPPTRPRLHASRTTSTTNTAMATRHRRSKENSENAPAGAEKENSGRAGRSTRTHVTPGVLSTTFVSSNLATFNSNSNSTSILGSKKALLAAPTTDAKPKKPTLVKRRVKKQPLQDVTAQFIASGMGEGANRAGTAYEHLEEEEILALREQSGGGGVELEVPAVEMRVATPGRGHRNQEPTSPLPPSSPPSDYRLPSSLTFNLAASVPLALPSTRPAEPVSASPTQSTPVPEYDPWGSFDSAPPVGSPTKPVRVVKEQDEVDRVDKEDPFGFAALERKLKADRAEVAPGHVTHEDRAGHEAHEEAQQEEEDEDIESIPVADTSSPRPEGMLLVRRRRGNNLKRPLEEEEEMDEEDEGVVHRYGADAGSSPVVPRRIRAGVLSLTSHVRAPIAAAGPASTPIAAAAAAADGSPMHAHFATPPTPHKETRKRRRISSVPDADDGALAHDVFGPCLPTSSSSPGQVQAESPSPTKGSVRKPATAATAANGAHSYSRAQGDDSATADALDAFNAVLDAQDAGAAAPMEEEEAGTTGRTLRPRASRAVLVDDEEERKQKEKQKTEKKSRSASRGRGRGRGLGRGTSRGRGSKSRGRGRGTSRAQTSNDGGGGGDEDQDEEVVDSDEKFEQARQARIAYFHGLDEYEVETEDVFLV